jgi:hypothetical protein
MFRRIAVVALLVGGGLAVAPSSASAEMCESFAYSGVTNATAGPNCLPYNGAEDCTTGTIQLGSFGTLWDDICLPAA